MTYLRDVATFLPMEERYWAVGSRPARLAHRVTADLPGEPYKLCVCGATVSLHWDYNREGWGEDGGRRYKFDDIPERYDLCMKCVAADEMVV